jgi:hypothetical protein
MAFDVEAAKADGYTDEEIQRYLNTKEIPVEQPIDRSEEALGTMQAALPQAAIYAGEGALLGYGAKTLKDVFANRASGPVAPAQTMQQPVPAAQAVNGRPVLSVQQGGAMPRTQPTAPVAPVAPTGAQSIVQKLALDKVLKNAGIIGAGMTVAQGLFGTSPEEIAKMKEAEARKRAQGWKPLNER